MANPRLIRSPMFDALGVTGIFTTRIGGMSEAPFDTFNLGYGINDDEEAVKTNLEMLLNSAGLPVAPHQASQEHGTASLICSGEGAIHPDGADILVACETDCPVAVRTADCLPVLLADPVNGIVAAVHAGWRGTAAGVVIRAVENMCECGADAASIHASLGPSIGPCCFEIGKDTADMLATSVSGAEQAILRSQRPHADLPAINAMQLAKAGLEADRIESLHQCTCCHPDLFFSYRRDRGKTGRHLAVVALQDDH